MKNNSFVHLHIHSHFSNDGLPSVEDIVIQAHNLGMKSVALTDVNSLAGAVALCKKAEELKIKPIYGCDLSILPFKSKNYNNKTFPITFLIENDKGYRNLVNLICIAHSNSSEGAPFVTYQDLKNQNTGLIALFGGAHGEITELLRNKKVDLLEEYLNFLTETFPKNNLYIELIPPYYADSEKVNKILEEIGNMLGISSVATNEVHYLNKEDSLPASFLIDMKIEPDISVEHFLNKNDFALHFASAAEMNAYFSKFQNAIDNTELIADRCNFVLNKTKKAFPKQDFDRGVDADSFLWNNLHEKVEEKFGTPSDTNINQRLSFELESIKENNLSDYFVLLFKISEYLQKNNVATGIGRGNLITSLVSYLSGITNIEPIYRQPMHFVPFSDNDNYPKFNLELPSNHIENIISFIISLYSERHLCFVGSYISPSRQNILLNILSKLGIPEISRTSYLTDEMLKTKFNNNQTIKVFLGIDKLDLKIKDPKVVAFIFAKLLNTQKTLKISSRQLTFASDTLSFLVPLQPYEEHKPYSASQYDVDSLSFFGMPVLTLHSEKILDAINLTLSYIAQEFKENISINQVSQMDKETYENLCIGRTTGIPFLESITCKVLLRRYKPQNHEALRKVVVESKKIIHGKLNKFMESDFIRSIIETDYGYKCAYLKTHYPAAFLTAMINTFLREKDISVYLREASNRGINVKPLDILTSHYEFQQNENEIRIGFSVLKNFDLEAFDELKRISKGFPYSNLYDLISNINLKKIPLNTIKKIIQSGAFDSVGNTSRTQMLENLNIIASRLGEDYVKDKPERTVQSEQNSITSRTLVSKDDPNVLFEWEINAANFPLTIDPIEINKKFLDSIYAIPPYKIPYQMKDSIVTLFGYINSIDRDSPIINDKNEWLLDFEGFLVRIPPGVLALYNHSIKTNIPVIILGKLSVINEEIEIKTINIYPLNIVKTKAEKTPFLTLNLAGENEQTLKEIYRIIKKFKGKTQLVLKNFPNEKKRIFRKVRDTNVLVCPILLHELRIKLTPENVEDR